MSAPTALYVLLGLSLLNLLLVVVLLPRGARQSEALSRPLRDELRTARAEQAAQARALREEVSTAGKAGEDRGEVVEFAIRLPGRDDSGGPIYLPIDAKFPHAGGGEDRVRQVRRGARQAQEAAQHRGEASAAGGEEDEEGEEG